jgi:putative ABC transport system substrate-binding protein
MNRRGALAVLTVAALAPQSLRAQRGRMPRVGYLSLISLVDPPSPERQAFLDGLREYGRVPGQNVTIVYRSAENLIEFLDETCAELLKDGVDVIVVSNALAIDAARRATSTVPIVMLAVGDPVGIGVVRSLARPGGNVTGVSIRSSELAAKRIQLLKEIAPSAARIAFVWYAPNAQARVEAETAIVAAEGLGMAVARVPVESIPGLPAGLEQVRAYRADALYAAFEGRLIGTRGAGIAAFCRRQRIALISGWSGLTDAGALMSYAPDFPALFRRAAFYVNRILDGTPPSNLPVEQANTVEMVVNLRTAAALGIRVPQAMLLRADRVVR